MDKLLCKNRQIKNHFIVVNFNLIVLFLLFLIRLMPTFLFKINRFLMVLSNLKIH
jgi:hypothetical protein